MAYRPATVLPPNCYLATLEPVDPPEPLKTQRLGREDREYLASIADISARMRPFEELASEASGCPDPDYYAEDEKWEF